MTPIKIYFDDYPGQNLAHSGQGTQVWHRNIFCSDKNYKNSLYSVLDLLGFPYVFSKDQDAIPVLDIGSLPPSGDIIKQLLTDTAEKFKKLIVCSTQEPLGLEAVQKLLSIYPNIFILDSSTPPANGRIVHERYASVPFHLCRSLSPRMHVTLSSGDDIVYNKQYKMFSCLMARWRIEKHLLFSLLSYNNLVKNNFVTYRSLFDAEDPELLDSNFSTDEKIKECCSAIYRLMPNNSPRLKRHARFGLYQFKAVTLSKDIIVHDAPFDSEKGNQQIMWHNAIVRGHPKFIFEDSFFSLICESFSGAVSTFDPVTGKTELKNTRSFISEKTMTPLMNGHPWLVFSEAGFHRTMESYGFVAHDELFNLDFDSDVMQGDRLTGIENNLLSLTKGHLAEKLQNLNSETHQKIRHNRYNVFNTSSVMWQELRKNMSAVIERFRDLDV